MHEAALDREGMRWFLIQILFEVISVGRFAVAEEDCTLALGLDSSYVKAYLRRGTARCRLSKFAQGRLGM